VLATIFFEIDGMTLSAVPLNAAPPHVNNFPCHGQDHVGFLWVVGQHSPSRQSQGSFAGDPRQLEKCSPKNRWQPKQHRHRGFPLLVETMTVDTGFVNSPSDIRRRTAGRFTATGGPKTAGLESISSTDDCLWISPNRHPFESLKR
jgi:hypothetical protein